ncbi:hypothetical protein FB45DRAFT_889183 [Roridomyces roridus]|uniref:DUF6534 domain-containing protein n=1 Tax=Roridomyces roridus TaxID=1738132 RepID=A0AAD7CKS7_9AGAR|nr:hypothetical protein FB45DRAFT_889183 [Roridomyces roridus]
MPNPALVYDTYILVAPWINCMLYMLEIVLIARYFQHARSRPRLARAGVILMFLFDTVCTIGVCGEAYYSLLVLSFDQIYHYTAVLLFSTYGTASIEQLFLCYIYFLLTKNRVITMFLIVPIFVHLGASYASAILVLKTNSPLGPAFMATKIGAISCASTDVLVASALMFTFIRMDITSAARPSTRHLLRRLVIMSFTSGVVVASTTLCVMIFLLKNNPVYLLFFYSQGRIYALTILTNFLIGLPNPAGTSQTTGATPVTVPVTNVVFRDYPDTSTGPRGIFTDINHSEIDMVSMSSAQNPSSHTNLKTQTTSE